MLKGKRILFIAPSSIPIDGPESIVNIKQLEVLAKSGCIIDVVSKKKKKYHYPYIEKIKKDICLNSINILEVDNRINWSTIKLHIFTYFTFGVVYKGAHWALVALQKCKELVEKNSYDFVMTKSFPSELVGFWIKKKKGIKWIATWNDPFPEEKYPIPYGRGIAAKVFWGAKKLIPIMEKFPDFHLFPSERLRNYMMEYLNISVQKTAIIPHIVLVDNINKAQILDRRCMKILHSGNVDYPRNPHILLQALNKFVGEYPGVNIEMYFQGVCSENLNKWITELSLGDIVKVLPATSYTENMNILSNYDVLLIIEAPCDEGIFLPTKVSDYMQTNKIIFAVSPKEGVLHDLYQQEYIGYFADCCSEKDVFNELVHLYNDFVSKKMRKSKIPIEYTPKYVTDKFDDIFRTLLIENG